MNKQTTKNSSGKNIYLLGKDTDGKKAWLTEPSWDCEWYWGFGYISGYTREGNPSLSKDITYHTHWDTSIVGKENGKEKSYCHNPFESTFFSETTFTEKEGWELAELFERFYLLKKSAGLFEKGGAHISGTDAYIQREQWAKEINEILIPETTTRILKILTP